MKQFFTILSFTLLTIAAQAQRYKDKLFATVSMDSILYGNALNWNASPQDLQMNIYQPEGDTVSKRPLIILAHGGSFISGTRFNPDVTYLCTEFARRGYVCASIQYRLGIDITKFFDQGPTQFANAVWRGVLDGRAAVRFLRAHADSLNINTEQIYIGGVSAGGVLGLHLAFLDTKAELNSADPMIDTVSIGGGIEGLSGTPGQSWRVKGLISLCGGIGTTSWMSDNRDLSIFSVHGTLDNTVPYKTDYFKANGINISKLSGGYVVDSMAKTLGMKSYLYTFVNAPHVPFSPGVGTTQSSTAYMDTTENLLRDFLVGDLDRKVGLPDVLSERDIRLYPNPVKEQLFVEVDKGEGATIEINSITGQLMAYVQLPKRSGSILTEGFNAGMYIITIRNEYGTVVKKFLVQ